MIVISNSSFNSVSAISSTRSVSSIDYSDLYQTPQVAKTGAVTVGVLSDSHIPFRLLAMPELVRESFRDCQIILHCGDVEDPAVLTQLGRLAPTHAVSGNIHWTYASGIHDLDLPKHLSLTAGPHHLWMTHGHWNFGHTFVDKISVAARSGARRLGVGVRNQTLQMVNESIVDRINSFKPATANLVIFGHSHARHAQKLTGTFFFNPGAVVGADHNLAPRSIGKLRLFESGRVEHEWINLQ